VSFALVFHKHVHTPISHTPLLSSLFLLFFNRHDDHRHLHSFPTRRSSDLATASNRITRDRRNREDFILHLMRVSQETEHSGSRPGAKTRVEPPGRLLLGFCPN